MTRVSQAFRFPYDLGRMKRQLREVQSPSTMVTAGYKNNVPNYTTLKTCCY